MSTSTQNIPWYRHLNRAQWRHFPLPGWDICLMVLILC